MKKLLITLLALANLASYAGPDCRATFSEYKALHLSESISGGVIFGGTIYGGLAVGGIVEATGNFGTTAALGSTLSISSAFVPMIIYVGIEGAIALRNQPYTKAIKLINQSYAFKKNRNDKKTRLLKRIARKLDMSSEDLAETIIRSNEDGSLCLENKTKKDIMNSIRGGKITIVNVDENSYNEVNPTWTCGAQKSYYQGRLYTASGEKRSKVKKAAKALCAKEEKVKKCKWILYCENNHDGTTHQYF